MEYCLCILLLGHMYETVKFGQAFYIYTLLEIVPTTPAVQAESSAIVDGVGNDRRIPPLCSKNFKKNFLQLTLLIFMRILKLSHNTSSNYGILIIIIIIIIIIIKKL